MPFFGHGPMAPTLADVLVLTDLDISSFLPTEMINLLIS
jgi:hypothetical protein